MTPIVRAIILLFIGVGLQLLLGLAVLPALFDVSGGTVATLTIIGVVFAGVFGFVAGLKQVYAMSPRGIWSFAIDATWSAINTATGLVFMIYCAAKGSYVAPTEDSQTRGIIHFADAALGGADATTIGTVMGGKWLVHETVHVQQARIFGPFYWPTYLASYLLNMLARFLTARFDDPHWQAYARVLMEDWAYRAAPGGEVKIFQSIVWFLLTLVNALSLGVLVSHVPVLGAIPALIGLTALPWWMGLLVLLVYALGRSYLPKANEPAAQVVFT
ncbi:hypothetical protein GON01_02130 [Sphingomonas sp. MAH-20]|uniref:Uncharacterized protein n=1 Tax=Sphingomonas horti TaxID=2682842 RepID=A0A6I4IX84_9SPHN|nr:MULTISPECIES: hypothetical protein [Sphingomonas]MBA2920487.1 hypothetical protein [Sphingomonas sp. CGMCC 1.13658]MVO76739.1 hypothetical protein [Sphingomonas horti]